MKYYLSALALLLSVTFVSGQNAKLNYTVNLNDRSDDLFRVTLDVEGFTSENDIYQFASTAPGTYQTMNVGRFVREFKAFDKKGKEIATEKIGENQFKLADPKKVKKITYKIAETWDTKVDKFVIYRMCGSSLEDDHALINGNAVFGYPKGMQNEPLTIKFEYPTSWMVGTALKTNENGAFYAETYDKIVDSPILLGRLTKASTDLNGAVVELYTYSKTDLVKSENLMNAMSEMLKAAAAFMIKLPVDRYTFLFHFEDEDWGAWEHSYSSEYVSKEQPYTEKLGANITSIAAHEFFHVVTPLNIHSEIIENFNFVTPTPSEHLWLYEGVTEWASDLMQLRYGLIDYAGLFEELTEKLTIDGYFDPTYSLTKLAETSFSEEGQKQYGNIYMRGALVAGLLDIRLLELSGGKRGLREVINELSNKYGPSRAFPEKDFFDIFTKMTHPEISSFFDNYVKNANPLPIAEFYGKLGIKYSPEISTGKIVPMLGIQFGLTDGKIRLIAVKDAMKEMGLQLNDEVIAINGEALTLQNGQKLVGGLMRQQPGAEYELTVKRGEDESVVKCKMLSTEEIKRHVFELDPNATKDQVALREAWSKNF